MIDVTEKMVQGWTCGDLEAFLDARETGCYGFFCGFRAQFEERALEAFELLAARCGKMRVVVEKMSVGDEAVMLYPGDGKIQP